MNAQAGDKIYEDARLFCYGVAREAARPFVRNQMADFTTAERLIVERMAEWMGSRDCEIERLRAEKAQLITLAKEATNALACLAKANYQHDEVSRLHKAIDAIAKAAGR